MPKSNIEDFAKSLKCVIDEIKDNPQMESGPEYQKFSDAFKNMANAESLGKIIRQFENIFIEANINSRRSILEVGSGYGVNLLILKFLGFDRVCGIELIESMNKNANFLINIAKKYVKFSLDDCYSLCGNAEATNFTNGEFDNVIAIEVISHVPSIDRFLREVNRILKDEGSFIIRDGNNHYCPYYRRKFLREWARVRDAELKKRIVFLKQHFPDIDPQFRASIALHTELLSLNDVKDAVSEIIRTNKLPMNLYFEGYAPVFSQSGIWVEYGLYPTKVTQQLKLYGFSSKKKVYIGSARGFPFELLEKIVNLFPDKIRFLIRPSFMVYAKKIDVVKYLVI